MSYIPAHHVFHAPAPAAGPAPAPTPAPTPKPSFAQHIAALPDAAASATESGAGSWPETQFTRARQVAFLHALADCVQVRRASAATGISYRTVYRERRANGAFARAWDAALLSARALGEDVLACRALDGVEEVVWFRGEEVGRRVRYDSRLLLAHLARLDKLTEDARLRAYADDLAGALERYEAGTDDPAPVCDDCGAALPVARTGGEGEGAPETFSPGPCDKCDMPSLKPAEGEGPAPRLPLVSRRPVPGEGGEGSFAERDARCHAARPPGAPRLDEFPGHDPIDVAEEQIHAFEKGVEDWWLVVPPPEDVPGDELLDWYWADGREQQQEREPVTACGLESSVGSAGETRVSDKTFSQGDKVSWNSSGGTAHGKVVKKLTSECHIKGHKVAASEDDPQYLVETEDGDQAAHKPDALTKGG